ncbi:MAG: FG-GAP-like repeat-containing protein [Myxococcota bacterium]|nr:FG-GAP-like repeat-containing protein [Myxococcota bacterium]
MNSVTLVLVLACGSPALKQAEEPTSPLLLDVDPNMAAIQPLPDRSELAQAVEPWDNFHTHDTLNDKHEIRVQPPRMMLVAQRDRYEKDPVGGILRDGKINFWTVAELYRKGLIQRENQAEIVASMKQAIAEQPGDHRMKANAVMGLVHIGFDEEAIKLIEDYKSEDWFSDDWDVNFYAGSLFFRYREYARSVPFLESAHRIHPDIHTRLWLRMALTAVEGEKAASRRNELFSFGEHLQVDSSEFPFRDRADFLGIRRWQLAGALSFLDMENDGFLDLVANGAYSHPELYRYTVGEGFVRTPDAGLDDVYNTPPGMVAADFDNDGFTDLYLTQAAWFSAGPNRLLKNNEGKGFVDVTNDGDVAVMDQNSCGAGALDFDGDGLVDLAVTGTMGGTLRLLRNTGDMVFEDVSEAAGIKPLEATAVGMAVGDVNNDGRPDLFVNTFSPPYGGVPGSGFTAPNQLYINQGDGTFVEEGAARGVAKGTSMGFAAWMFDYDNDGDMDILASNFSRSEERVVQGLIEPKAWEKGYHGAALYKNDGSGNFENIAEKVNFLPSSIMGAQFVDFELDGDLDVVLGPGSHPLSFMQPALFYRNDGNDVFTLTTPLEDPHFYGKFHGMAFADIDRDGDADLFMNNGGVMLSDRWRDLFLENTTTGKNWLHLRFVGTKANRSAIGARVEVKVGERTLVQEVAAGQGFSSTNSPFLIFGLDSATASGPITVRWPGGEVQEIPALAGNQAVEITEGQADMRRVY